jgi:hypothetical protein
MVWKCVAVLCVCVMAVGAGAEPELTTISPRGKSFTVTTEPVQLSHGQVHNTFGKVRDPSGDGDGPCTGLLRNPN